MDCSTYLRTINMEQENPKLFGTEPKAMLATKAKKKKVNALAAWHGQDDTEVGIARHNKDDEWNIDDAAHESMREIEVHERVLHVARARRGHLVARYIMFFKARLLYKTLGEIEYKEVVRLV